jgi:hypothetical protein
VVVADVRDIAVCETHAVRVAVDHLELVRAVELAVRPRDVAEQELGAAEGAHGLLESDRDAELDDRLPYPLGNSRFPGHRLGRCPKLDLRLERKP